LRVESPAVKKRVARVQLGKEDCETVVITVLKSVARIRLGMTEKTVLVICKVWKFAIAL
jgi:hypothetical protein